MADVEVRVDRDAHRYEVVMDGRVVGIAEYVDAGATVVFPHTEITPSMRGRGLAATLVGWALDDVRHSGRQVVPSCWYVARFIEEHPEYRDLLVA